MREVENRASTPRDSQSFLQNKMRFSTLFTAFAVVATGASATTSFTSDSITNALFLTAENHYGAPIPPWEVGHYPGWYYGKGSAPSGILYILDEVKFIHTRAKNIVNCDLPVVLRAFGAVPLLPPLPQAPAAPAAPPASPASGVQPDFLQPDLRHSGRQLYDLRTGRHCRR